MFESVNAISVNVQEGPFNWDLSAASSLVRRVDISRRAIGHTAQSVWPVSSVRLRRPPDPAPSSPSYSWHWRHCTRLDPVVFTIQYSFWRAFWSGCTCCTMRAIGFISFAVWRSTGRISHRCCTSLKLLRYSMSSCNIRSMHFNTLDTLQLYPYIMPT